MTIEQMLKETGFKLLSEDADCTREIHGVYCGDLLSWVMGNGQPSQAWITVQAHINAVAVAVLREFSCIIFAENAAVSEEVLARAKEEHLAVIASGLPVYETAVKLAGILH